MEKELWERLLANWERTYYTEPLWILCSIFAAFIAIYFYLRKRAINLLFLYPITSITSLIFGNYVVLIFDGRKQTATMEMVNTLFAIIEVSIFFGYFMPFISSKKIKKTLVAVLILYNLSAIAFTIGLIVLDFSKWQILTYSFRLNVLEMLLLLVICLRYFFELMLRKPSDSISLTILPSMWIASGLLVYVLVSLPLLLIGDTLHSFSRSLYFIMFAVHYLSISIFLICIAKALTCKTPQPI